MEAPPAVKLAPSRTRPETSHVLVFFPLHLTRGTRRGKALLSLAPAILEMAVGGFSAEPSCCAWIDLLIGACRLQCNQVGAVAP